MKTGIFSLLILSCILVGFPATAGEPVLHLQPGNNSIAVSVVNQWNYDLKNVSAFIDENVLPYWITSNPSNELLNISKGQSGICTIDFLVDESTVPASTANHMVTLHFKDSMGNQWDQDVTIQLDTEKPRVTRLIGNHPNPCNPSTVITYSIGNPGTVKLYIYNIQGQKIKTLVHDHREPGQYDIRWNGVDDRGNHVASGMYIYRMQAGTYTASNKLMLIQ